MAQQGLRFEDILKAQQRLAAQGDSKAAQMIQKLEGIQKNLEEDLKLSHQDRILQGVQVYEAIKADKDDDKIVDNLQKGLLDTEGDGLNANVVKLVDVLKGKVGADAVAAAGGNGAGTVTPDKVTPIKPDQYFRGPSDTARDIKGIFSPAGMFDLDASSGMLADFLKKKVARDQFVKDELAADPTKDPKQLKQQFNQINETIGQQQRTQAEIERLEAKGFTKDDKNLADLYERKRAYENKREALDPRYARQKAAEASTPSSQAPTTVESSFAAAATGAAAPSPTDVLAGSTTGLVGSSEAEAENIRLFQAQNQMIESIKANTEATNTSVNDSSGKGVLAAIVEMHDTLKELRDNVKNMEGGGGGGGLGSLLGGAAAGAGGAAAASKAARAAAFAGKALPVAATVGAGAYGLYNASNIEEKEAAGEITKAEAFEQQTENLGMVGGVGAGAAVGAGVGAAFGGIGAIPGALIGAGIGYLGGTTLGKYAGRGIYSAYQGVKGLFGGGDQPTPKVSSEPQQVSSPPKRVSEYYEVNGVPVSKEVYEANRASIERRSAEMSDPNAQQRRLAEMSKMLEQRAAGGPVNAGQPYLVGEKGPEIVVPDQKGKVIPSGKAATIDLGNGVKKTVNSDGSYSISDAQGIRKYDPAGNIISSTTPTFAGYSQTAAGGQIREDYSAGALTVSQTKDASGNMVGSSSSYQIADQVYMQSGQNAAMATQPTAAQQAPVIINAPTNVQQNQNYGPKSPPRNTESSYQQYAKSRFAY